ncbi:hypothetical protein F4813DRAFT_53486 [Daldinia decipiens]|uniref:uncharacterized protein n=1 Tax=Daldinia decipiens TaxID=326647 RepID=UPI0020C589C8|nr:uncharacterized protein F4813DRAFT_53486 [Daldinia decipiens]KAI1658083.1 hypothetical protein F4813DRAFT_53486 [Daldinia decipiens]
MDLIAILKMNTINWTCEIQLIIWACFLTIVIVKSIMIISDKLIDSPAYNSATNHFASYIYQPSSRLRNGPIGPSVHRQQS